MTTFTTPVFGVTYADDLEPLANYPAVTQAVAATLEAALSRGGLATPDVASLAAEITARVAGDNGTAGVFTYTTGASGWADYGAPFAGMALWKIGKTVFCTALAKNTAAVAASATSVIGTLPAGWAPAATVVTPQHYDGINPCRVDVQANGQVVLNTALMASGLTAGRFVTVNAHWRIP